jgi:hypothetical protein
VSVEAESDELSNAIFELMSSAIVFSLGRIHTFVIDRH